MIREREPHALELESSRLSPPVAMALLRLVEAAPEVKRRYQFFVWLQSHVQPLVPHTLALCGAYSRQRKQLVFEAFNTVVLPPTLLDLLTLADSPMLAQAIHNWVEGQGRPFVLTLGAPEAQVYGPEAEALMQAGLARVAVHGVARPDRPHEVESLFLLAGPEEPTHHDITRTFELIIHALHATYARTQSFERELGAVPVRLAAPAPAGPTAPRITPREVQILSWVREGKSNQEIGLELGISALTVKNHIQKILRKLGASNRAHAVALAMQARLLQGSGGQGRV
jgi:transcriptional regulator EpsA